MDDTTKKVAQTIAIGIVKKTLIWGGAILAGHGVAVGFTPTDYAAAAAAIVATGWSLWNDYGKGIVLGELEVVKAHVQAQTAKIRAAGLPPVTVTEIANQNNKLTTDDVAKMVVKVLLVAFALSFLLAGSQASAQTKPAPQPADFLAKLVNDLSAKKVEFVNNVVAAIQEADDDAATLTNPNDPTSFRDPISHACYPAQIKFLNSLPQVQAIKAPAPYNLIVLFQRKRDLIAQVQAGLPVYLKLNCAALLGDEKTIFLKTLGLLGITVAGGALTGLFPAAAPITLPALSLGL